MKIPQGPRTWISSACRKLQSYHDKSWWVRWVLIPLIVYLPPAFIAAWYSIPTFAKEVTEFFPQNRQLQIQYLADNYVLLWVLIPVVWAPGLIKIGQSIVTRNQSSVLSVDGLNYLMETIEDIVARKYKRFYKAIKNPDLSRDQLFDEITQPQIQIEELVRGISHFFNIIRSEPNKHALIRVTMVGVQNNAVSEILLHFPQDEAPRADISVLRNSQSAFSRALQDKRMIIIPDIAKELKKAPNKRRFAESPVMEDNLGSLICYPIRCRCSSEVPYVIAIHCEEPKYFSETFKELYEHTLARFETRINVEHNLFLLKERFK